MAEYIDREAAYPLAKKICDSIDSEDFQRLNFGMRILDWIDDLPAADVRPVPEGGIGEMSDGYHTFNGLYYQRMVLFAALVNAYQDRAWKSWKHEDGKPCFDGGWFIVGIDTPQGSYTYHYEDKYWNWFECKELPVAKHWDGHTEEDVTRLLTLDVRPVVRGKWISHDKGWWRLRNGNIATDWHSFLLSAETFKKVCDIESTFSKAETEWKPDYECSVCGSRAWQGEYNFCPNCGADMR